MATILDMITNPVELVDFYESYVLQQMSQRKLSIQLFGKGHQAPANGTAADVAEVGAIPTWKQTMQFYQPETLPYV